MNPSTAFATVLVDELIRCGLREAVIAPVPKAALSPVWRSLTRFATVESFPVNVTCLVTLPYLTVIWPLVEE